MRSPTIAVVILRMRMNLHTDEFEMYNLTKDPIESRNLANPEFAMA